MSGVQTCALPIFTDEGIQALAASRRRHQAARSAHEALVERVALEMQRAGRTVWRGLGLRSPLAGDDGKTRWSMAMPDVFSIRNTTAEDHVEPIVHEIKVSRADLLADLRRPAKAQAYLALASQCWYVVREGIASERDVPPLFGLIVASDQGLAVARPAPRRPMRMAFGTWMALAQAAPVARPPGEEQALLGPQQGDADRSAIPADIDADVCADVCAAACITGSAADRDREGA